MVDIVAIPLKKTSELDLVKPLKNLISLRFSTADNPESFDEAIVELNRLRSTATNRTLDKTESSIDIYARYCDQLAALEGKFPPQDLQIGFKWKDAFDKGTLFGGKMSLTISSIAYERMCSLFNLAAFQSQVASIQSHENDESLKLAAKLLQSAAGIFSYLRAAVMGALQQEPTPDMSPETLAALSALMLAEAQELFVMKAINDKMKEANIAKLSSQCEEYYSEALKMMQSSSSRNIWDRDWIPKISAKQLAYQATSQYYQSRVCNTKKLIGEEISRLQVAIEGFKSAQQKMTDPAHYNDYINRSQRFLADAQKDNDFIYHERVPDAKNLEPIAKATFVKISPLPEHLSPHFKDLFENLTPIAIHQALAAWEVRKLEIVNVEVGRLREANQFLNGVLASLNLPAALEESAGESLPQSLKEKARAVRQAGGINMLKSLIAELPSLMQRNKEILDEAERLLTEERESDDQLKAQFKERWNRTPSSKLTEAFIANISKYRQILANATSADAVVQGKFEANRRGIEMLSRSEEELEQSIPSASQAAADNSRSPAAAQLRILMSRVDELKSEREVMEHELKSATIDMKSQFLSALAQDGAINEPAMSVEKLGEIYGPLQKRIRESIDFQGTLIAEIQHLNEDFVRDKSGGKGPSPREELLKELAAAHDIHMEVQNNLEEGTKFYNDLTQLLLSFQNKVSDFCFARKAEKEELLKDLTSSYAAPGTGTSAPSLPSHHAVGSTTSAPSGNVREVPARPPPPNFNAHSAPTTGSAPAPSVPQMPQHQGQANPYLPYPMQTYMPMPYYPPAQPENTQPGAHVPNYGYPPQGMPPNQPGAAPGPYPGYPAYPYPNPNPNPNPYYSPNPGYPYPTPRPPQW